MYKIENSLCRSIPREFSKTCWQFISHDGHIECKVHDWEQTAFSVTRGRIRSTLYLHLYSQEEASC